MSLLPGWHLSRLHPLNPVLFMAGLFFWAGLYFPATLFAATVTWTINGLQGEMLANVQANLELSPGVVTTAGVVERNWLERHTTQIPALVDQALRPYGYYRSTTRYELKSHENGKFQVVVEIDPGPAVIVSSVQVKVHGGGAGEQQLQGLAKNFPLKEGGILDQQAYEKGKNKLRSTALNLGYLDADFSRHALTINEERSSCRVELILETGLVYRFGEITISGAPEYPPAHLQRYISFHSGEIFSYAELGQTQVNLLNVDAFHEVVVTPQKELAVNQAVPVAVKLSPDPRHSLRPGIGYSSDNGPRFSLRYLNRNVKGLGHKFNSDLNLSETRQSLIAVYTIPDRANIDSESLLKIGLENDTPETYETRIVFIEAERLKGFGDGRIGSFYLRLQQEESEIGSANQKTARLVLPGVRWKAVPFDGIKRPENGYSYRLEVRGTHQGIGSDTNLLQLLWGGTILLPLPGPFKLLSRLDGGTTWQNDSFGQVPASLRFFAGGDSSVRGYDFETLGPVDAAGEVIGGRNLLTVGTDLECAIGENWGAVVFYDIGNAFDSWMDFKLMQGTGVGVRRYTVIGPVKLDLARQINVPEPAWRVHISIGFSW